MTGEKGEIEACLVVPFRVCSVVVGVPVSWCSLLLFCEFGFRVGGGD